MFSSVTKPHFITMDNSTGITIIIGPYTILTGLNVLIINIVGVNIWCGIINAYLIGLYFFNRLNEEIYLSFLQNKLPELLEEVDLATRQKMWWQQDASPPPHSHHIVMEYFNIFHERWIGRYGYISYYISRFCCISTIASIC